MSLKYTPTANKIKMILETTYSSMPTWSNLPKTNGPEPNITLDDICSSEDFNDLFMLTT